MNREQILKAQPRSHMQGIVTCINHEWIFFDDETDEAYLLNEIVNEEIELFIAQTWIPGILVGDDGILIDNRLQPLQESTSIRIPKTLQTVYVTFLQELCDYAFLQFTNTLKELNYSIYDCMVCHNFLTFQSLESPTSGVNFFLFDNEDMVCSVHHHFIRNESIIHDKFEFVRADGLKIECRI